MSLPVLDPGHLDLAFLRNVFAAPVAPQLHPRARAGVDAAAATVAQVLAEGRVVYGINTGFGALARTVIEPARLEELQRALIRSHSAGTGPRLEPAVVRLVLVLKVASLGRGHSGVRPAVIDGLLGLLAADVLPCIPSQGSVGASGDLAPLAHLAGVLMGEGEADVAGRVLSAPEALAAAGLAALTLAPKEGLALINGTQVSTAIALAGLFAAERAMAAAFVAGAMSVDACLGSDTPFDARIQAVRGHRGQRDAAAIYRALLDGSGTRDSHRHCHRVQDPYSLRCQPQVMGACLDVMRHVADVLVTEANAVSDNPLVFPADGDILSGGNFHAEPVAFAADHLALAIAEIGALAERRIALLTDSHLSGLPPFLVQDSGVNSGFMLAQVTAAALASENKALAHPHSVDSLPTSANQEDHVSMATNAARRLLPMARNTAGIAAVELLAAAQGIDFRCPLRTSETLERAHAAVRALSPFWDCDRRLAPELAAVTAAVESGAYAAFVPTLVE